MLNWRGYSISNAGGCWACFSNTSISWFEGSTFTGAQSTSNTAPVCFFNCTNLGGGTNMIYSFHPGAGGVAMCDGSAHMLNENISVSVMLGMATFAGREPLTDTFAGR